MHPDQLLSLPPGLPVPRDANPAFPADQEADRALAWSAACPV